LGAFSEIASKVSLRACAEADPDHIAGVATPAATAADVFKKSRRRIIQLPLFMR
jgi:hypothetical protein